MSKDKRKKRRSLIMREFIAVLLEKFEIIPYVSDIRPRPLFNRDAVKIVYLRALRRKEYGRMSGDYKLTVEKARGVADKIRQLLLMLYRQAVFRLVDEIKRISVYHLRKVAHCRFTV